LADGGIASTLDVCSGSSDPLSGEGVAVKFSDVTPNLVVASVERSLAFYRDVLGFALVTTVPEAAPFAFAWMQRDGVSVFLNSLDAVRRDQSELASRPIGGTATLFVVLEAEGIAEGVDALRASIASRARVTMELRNQFYGMREFAIEDPDGYVIIFAQQLPA
jgi:catechol 2,3-dioxygenase-like lactoylglutathione lyase family enzyme